MNFFYVLMFFGFFSSQILALEPSFDCSKSKGYVEKSICGNGYLAEMDIKLNQLYVSANRYAGQSDQLKAFQINWIKKRNICKDLGCIENSYRDRAEDLYKLIRGYTRRNKIFLDGCKADPIGQDAGSTSFKDLKYFIKELNLNPKKQTDGVRYMAYSNCVAPADQLVEKDVNCSEISCLNRIGYKNRGIYKGLINCPVSVYEYEGGCYNRILRNTYISRLNSGVDNLSVVDYLAFETQIPSDLNELDFEGYKFLKAVTTGECRRNNVSNYLPELISSTAIFAYKDGEYKSVLSKHQELCSLYW